MVGKRHDNLLRDIEGYIAVLDYDSTLRNGSNTGAEDFFVKSDYQKETNGRYYNCYLLTKKGCDMVANKITEKECYATLVEYIEYDEEEKDIITNQS
jgi:phage regulator Rha-like protein